MARLSYEERLNRLETRYNELVKPVFIIAEADETGVSAITILSTGKKQEQHFSTYADFEVYTSSIENCNIICNNQLLSFRTQELSKALEKASTSDLIALAEDRAEADVVKRVIFDGITSLI